MGFRLVASGVSRRQAAKVLGVSRDTINKDVQGGRKSAKNGSKSATHPTPQREEKLLDQIDRENPQNHDTERHSHTGIIEQFLYWGHTKS